VVLLVLGWMSDFNAERIEMKVRIVEK